MTNIIARIFRNKLKILTALIIVLFSPGADAQIINTFGPGLNYPYFEALDSAHNLYVSDGGQLRIISSSGTVRDWIGSNSTSGYSGDNGPATAAQIDGPQGVAIDDKGNFYFADQGNSCVRKVDAAGIITTVAGIGTAYGFSGDNGQATQAMLFGPTCIAADKHGNLYITDQHNNRIRKVNAAGIITTIAGIDSAGFSGDGGPATNAAINQPVGIAVDTTGNVFFADKYNNRIRKINTAGIISTIAGCDTGVDYGDNIQATTELLSIPMGITTDNYGNIYIADLGHNQIRKVDKAGIITNVAGFGIQGFSGDGGPAIYAFLAAPTDVKVDASGDMYIVDEYNFRIRYVADKLATPLPAENKARLSLYPNPCYSSYTLTIESRVTGEATVIISNEIGLEMQRFYARTNTPVTVSPELATGLYFISAYTSEGIVTERIMVVK